MIYRDTRMVNWCCQLQTVISDIEIEHTQVEGPAVLTLRDGMFAEPRAGEWSSSVGLTVVTYHTAIALLFRGINIAMALSCGGPCGMEC